MRINFAGIRDNIVNALTVVIILWLVTIVNIFIPYDICQWGIQPRTIHGLWGIAFAPLLHANFYHLISNTIPIFVLILILLTFYKREAPAVLFFSILIGGGLVWLFGRSAIHVGVSGLIYSLAAFLISAGILKREILSIVISIIIILMYGSLIWGILPGKFWISWEGHLFGALTGIFLAFKNFRKNRT